jgi:hypothetical protein
LRKRESFLLLLVAEPERSRFLLFGKWNFRQLFTVINMDHDATPIINVASRVERHDVWNRTTPGLPFFAAIAWLPAIEPSQTSQNTQLT